METNLPGHDEAPKTSDGGDSSKLDRRAFVAGAAAFAAVAGVSTLAALSPRTMEKILRRQFRELSPEAVDRLIRKLEADLAAQYGRPVSVGAAPPLEKTSFGYGLDLSRCIGCRRCVYACVRENNQGRDPQLQWIRVLRMEKEKGIDLEEADPYYDPKEVPEAGHFYMPVACHQCKRPPCVQVCPVGATWREPDGIVVIDYDWCIGCRCCMAACPYGARRFNWAEPRVPAEELNTDMHVLGNRPRMKGVVEKCTFCIHRVRKGRYPACVEICPVGARKFGNLLDENSDIRRIMREKHTYVLKEEVNTQPTFFYFYTVSGR